MTTAALNGLAWAVVHAYDLADTTDTPADYDAARAAAVAFHTATAPIDRDAELDCAARAWLSEHDPAGWAAYRLTSRDVGVAELSDALALAAYHTNTLTPPDSDLARTELENAVVLVATLASLVRDGRLVVEPPREICGADFMAGTECDLPPGHSGGHCATYLL